MRATQEVWARGVMAVGLAVAALGWWLVNWLLHQEISVRVSALGFGAIGIVSLVVAGIVSVRRIRAA